MHTRPPSADPQGATPDRDGAYNVRSVPVRIYLPDGPVLQDLVPPLLEDGMSGVLGSDLYRTIVDMQTLCQLNSGSTHTLQQFLSHHLPQLFPPSLSEPPFHDLGYALIQGVVTPPEAEMAWLGACMSGADGWVNVCVGVLRDGRQR